MSEAWADVGMAGTPQTLDTGVKRHSLGKGPEAGGREEPRED